MSDEGANDTWVNRTESIFLAAIEQPAAHRAAFLEQACTGDARLLEDVRSLLHHHDSSGDFLGTPVLEAEFPSRPPVAPLLPEIGETIGPCRLLEILGEGGFGIVYLAEQSEPIRRRVALKLVKPGMDSRQVLRRFRTEERALALMDHPGVARVFEAGVTGEGRPYFVMELVEGPAITTFADEHALGLDERLELFESVCEAVQHAHQKGIIHRDLKPSNILIARNNGQVLPKVIDFGVAKALDQPAGEHTMVTAQLQLLGTPAYMSPEQAQGTSADLDTRSDIYALGVLLYELLVGTPPFDFSSLQGSSFAQLQEIIARRDPPRPSAAAIAGADSEARARRRACADARGLARELRGDLDWITMRAMEKDRSRRYATASELASDIARHRRHEPVMAGPPTAAYRVAKFVRRHRTAVTLVATTAALLLAGIAATSWQSVRATRAEQLALREAAVSRAVNDFLNEMLGAADPHRTADRDITVREVLNAASAQVETKFQDQPLVEAAVRQTIGTTYLNMGRYDQAAPHLIAALEVRRHHLGDSDAQTMASSDRLAELYFLEGRYEESLELLERTLEPRLVAPGEEDLDTLTNLGNIVNVLGVLGRWAQAEPLARRDYATSRRVLGEKHQHTLTAANNLAYLLMQQGRLADADQLVADALESRRRDLGAEHPETLAAMNNLARLHSEQGELEAARDLYEQTLEICGRVLGPEHPHTLRTATNLAQVYTQLGRLEEAETLYHTTLATQRRVLGAGHDSTLITLASLAALLHEQERPAEAEERYAEVIEGFRIALPEAHWRLGSALADRGSCLIDLQRYADAESDLLEALRIAVANGGPDGERAVDVSRRLVLLYESWGRPEEAGRYRRP